jgi:hypothetical protein
MSSPTPYKEVSETAYSMPGFSRLNEGDKCEIVEINGKPGNLKHNFKYKENRTFSQGPFIPVTFKSHGEPVSSSYGKRATAIVTRNNGKEIKQEDTEDLPSFYFVVNGGKTATFNGGRKSRRRKTNKNKRIRRKSMKRLHRRK